MPTAKRPQVCLTEMSFFFNSAARGFPNLVSPMLKTSRRLYSSKNLKKMTTVNLNNLELNEFIARDDSTQHCLATFPLVGAHGSKKIATVYFELLPGERLGSHIDSAEELLVILSGDVEITIGGETAQASASTVALVPEQVPHDIRNIGTSKVRVLGVFGGVNHIVATFENIWLPTHSRIVNTAEIFEA